MNYIQKRKALKKEQAFRDICQSIGYYTLLAAGAGALAVISIISLNIIL